MGLFSRIFGRSETETTGKNALLSDPFVKQASRIADEGIALQQQGQIWSVSTNTDVVTSLVDAINRALESSPSNGDLLVAKYAALALSWNAAEAPGTLRHALDSNPEHFDAKMLQDYSDSWQHLFHFPSWSEEKTRLPEPMVEWLHLQQSVQVVRDGLSLSIAIVNPASIDGFPKNIRRSAWKLNWSRTPHGPIAFHYAMLDCGGGDIRKQESGLPHIADSKPTVRSGYWLLRRLPHIRSCFIIFANGSKVLYNERYKLPSSMKNELIRMDYDLKRSGPISSAAECQPAAQWYMQNVDFESIGF